MRDETEGSPSGLRSLGRGDRDVAAVGFTSVKVEGNREVSVSSDKAHGRSEGALTVTVPPFRRVVQPNPPSWQVTGHRCEHQGGLPGWRF